MGKRVEKKLGARTVAALKQPGRHSDGGGLYLSISKDGPAALDVPVHARRQTLRVGFGRRAVRHPPSVPRHIPSPYASMRSFMVQDMARTKLWFQQWLRPVPRV